MNIKTKDRLRQTICPIAAAMIWGMAFIFQSIGSNSLDSFAFNFGRGLLATIFLGIVILFRRKFSNKHSEKNIKNNTKSLWLGGILSGLALSAASIFQQFGIADTNPGKAAFVTTLYIVLVPIIGILLGKKLPISVLISVALSITGLYFLCITEKFTLCKADIFLIICAFGYAFQITFIDIFGSDCDSFEFNFIQFLTLTVVSLIPMLIFEKPEISQFIDCAVPLLFVGIMSSGIAYGLQVIAQKNSNATLVTLLLSLESVFATVSAAIFQPKTTMSIREIFGCVLMFGAVILSQINFDFLHRKTK